MTIERDRWYSLDDEDGGRETVYVNNILQSFSTYNPDAEDGERDGVFIQLSREVDGYGAMPPYWSLDLDEFLARNPETAEAPEGGRED